MLKPAPVVSAVLPGFGLVPTPVLILGSNLADVETVRFGTTPATIILTDHILGIFLLVLPPLGTGTVDVTATSPAGTSAVSPTDRYTYMWPPPPPPTRPTVTAVARAAARWEAANSSPSPAPDSALATPRSSSGSRAPGSGNAPAAEAAGANRRERGAEGRAGQPPLASVHPPLKSCTISHCAML